MSNLDMVLIAVMVLQALDAWTTLRVLRKGGFERNPVVGWLMGRFGQVAGLMAAKAVAVGCAVVAYRYGGPYALHMLVIMGAIYAVVVVNNFRVGGGK